MTECVVFDEDRGFDFDVDIVVVGAGGCGLCAALAAADGDASVVVLERDSDVSGTTGMSTGLIPAAGTPEQNEAGIADTPEIFANDILAKSNHQADEAVIAVLAAESEETVAWLRDSHGVPLSLVDGFVYPGHTHRRMYGTPNRTGSELMAALIEACSTADVDILTDARVETLICKSDGTVRGVEFVRPDGERQTIGCSVLILATCGFAGNPEMVSKWIPEMDGATLHGHPGADGDAVKWGEILGAALMDMTGYQGHGGLAYGLGVPILWPCIMQGGIQINAQGERFSDESKGYSEQAKHILAQPDGVAWTVFDARIEAVMQQFDDYQDAQRAEAIKTATTIEDLAAGSKMPFGALQRTLDTVTACHTGTTTDAFGRDFTQTPPLEAPFKYVRVSSALFHTQGGLAVDSTARVLRTDGSPFPNLFAGGGAARGVSGPCASGYIAGNGLLTATSLGKLAGRTAAGQLNLQND